MPIIYKDCNTGLSPKYTCDPCGTAEKGRVSGVAFVNETMSFTDISDEQEWVAGIESGDIIVIPATSGTFDGGAPVMSTGYGRQKERLSGYDFLLTIKDPHYTANGEFWDTIKNRSNYRVAFMTATQVHMSENSVYVVPKNPVEEDVNTEVTWQAEIKWSGTKLSIPKDGMQLAKSIFRCFEVK